MPPSRLICRAHNRFTPSIALWQHFVLPNRPSPHQQRLSSSPPRALQHDADSDGASPNSHLADSSQPLEAGVDKTEKQSHKPHKPHKPSAEPASRVRRIKATRGQWLPSKAKASIAKNIRLQEEVSKASLAETDKLLANARDAFKRGLDYTGVILKPMMNVTPVKESALPWCLHAQYKDMSGIERLKMEIERFYHYTRPSTHEQIARSYVIDEVRDHVRKTFREYDVEVFGSERTGLALATSDIDFRLLRPLQTSDPVKAIFPPPTEERNAGKTALYTLLKRLRERQGLFLLPKLLHARYPLISAQHEPSGLDIQVVLANDTLLSRVVMQDYMDEYPYLQSLHCIIKVIFDVRGLSDPYLGGFGSYSLFMMVVASIKHSPQPINNAAEGLVHFLTFWGKFDTRKHGISIEPTFLFDKAKHAVVTDTTKSKLKKGENKPLPSYMLSLRDPADETNDLGRKAIIIKHVQTTLKALSHQLDKDVRMNTRHSLLGPMAGTSYMISFARRKKLRTYGKETLDRIHASLHKKAKAVRDGHSLEPERYQPELKTRMEDDETMVRLAKEHRDKEWQRLAEERKAQEWLET